MEGTCIKFYLNCVVNIRNNGGETALEISITKGIFMFQFLSFDETVLIFDKINSDFLKVMTL